MLGLQNAPPEVLRAREAARIRASHEWCVFRGVMRCRNFWAVRSKHGAAARDVCHGQSALHRHVAAQAEQLGHDLWGADVIRAGCEPSALLICMQHGAFVEAGQNPALHERHCRPPGRHGLQQIRRVRHGLHPRTGDMGRGASLQHLQRLQFMA